MITYRKPTGQTFEHAYLESSLGCNVAEMMFSCNGGAPWYITLIIEHDTCVGHRRDHLVITSYGEFKRRSSKRLHEIAEEVLRPHIINDISVKIDHALQEMVNCNMPLPLESVVWRYNAEVK